MPRITSGSFTARDEMTKKFIKAMQEEILTEARYFKIETGIEHRFGSEALKVHEMLYNNLGPTTDLLRYFPDSLYFDRLMRMPTWKDSDIPQGLEKAATKQDTGLFCFFAEFKYSGTERPRKIGDVPTCHIGQIEREAWLNYRRLSQANPQVGLYLDRKRARIALFYAASYAPDRLYACWEETIEPLYIHKAITQPGKKSVQTNGSGTPWINFDLRKIKSLERFLVEDLHWPATAANAATSACKAKLHL